MPIAELDKFRQKYPQYNDLDDRVLATKLSSKYPQYNDLFQKVGEPILEQPKISTPKEIIGGIAKTLPTIGQVGGGIAGGLAGAPLMGLTGPLAPTIGSAVGGTLGRGAGAVLREQVQESPLRTAAGLATFSMPAVSQALLPPLPKEAQMRVAKETGAGALGEVVSAPIGLGIGTLGKAALKTFIPKTVAQRGIEKGFSRLLNPEYYKESLPQGFVQRVSNMFGNAQKKMGSNVVNAINKPRYQKPIIDTWKLQQEAQRILPKGISIEDMDASPMQKKMMQNLTNKLLGIGEIGEGVKVTPTRIAKSFKERWKNIPQLWGIRKEIDDVMYGHTWSGEAYDYLNKLRGILNNPIRSAGKNIAKAFDEYSFLMDSKDILGKNTADVIKRRATGEVFGQNVETFIKGLMSPDKSSTRSLLKAIDPELAEEMLDVAAAKVLGKQVIPSSPSSLLGKFISPKTAARVGAIAQTAPARAIRTTIRRAIPSGVSGVLSETFK